jgi:hypothetical protein
MDDRQNQEMLNLLVMESRNPDGSVPLWVRDQEGNWHWNATPEVKQHMQEAMAKMANELVEGQVLEAVAELQDAVVEAQTIAEAAQERAEEAENAATEIFEKVCEYNEEIVAPEVERIEEQNEVLLDVLDATIELSGLTGDEVVARVGEMARRGAVDRGDSYSERVSRDNSARNRASVQGPGRGRGVNGTGDQGGAVRESVECDPRVARYVAFINGGSKGGGLTSPQRVPMSITEAVTARSGEHLHEQAEELRKGDAYADAVSEIERRRKLGLSWT